MNKPKVLKPEINFILISCCTCMRPKMLSEALESIKKIKIPRGIKVELLVVDNDKFQTARKVVEDFQTTSKIKSNYCVEEQRGIANARNRVLKEAIALGASHIAFLDDDEIVDENWLFSHVAFYQNNEKVFISSGPTFNKFKKSYPRYITQNKIFKQSSTKLTGEERTYCASGNVFFPVSIAKDAGIFFDNSYVFMGGEDGDFFKRASKEGYAIYWNGEAINYEMIGDERANIKWIMNRQHYNGYSSSLLKFKNKKTAFQKSFYFLKTSSVFLFNIGVLIPSIVLGLTTFFNVLGMLSKTKGKIDGTIKNIPLNYYENICGT